MLAAEVLHICDFLEAAAAPAKTLQGFFDVNSPRLLWVQQGAEAELSGLVGRPDFL